MKPWRGTFEYRGGYPAHDPGCPGYVLATDAGLTVSFKKGWTLHWREETFVIPAAEIVACRHVERGSDGVFTSASHRIEVDVRLAGGIATVLFVPRGFTPGADSSRFHGVVLSLLAEMMASTGGGERADVGEVAEHRSSA